MMNQNIHSIFNLASAAARFMKMMISGVLLPLLLSGIRAIEDTEGNEIIHKITSHGNHELRIDMTDFYGNSKYAAYRVFGLGDEASGYPLLILGYTGTAGDSLYISIHNHISNGAKFITYDRDNDIHPNTSCAQQFSGAWWYTDCHLSNLNGKYLGGYHKSFADGIEWFTWKGQFYSVKTVKMMFRKY